MNSYSPLIDRAFKEMDGSSMRSSLVAQKPLSAGVTATLKKTDSAELVAPRKVHSGAHAELIKAALFLWNDEFDLAHEAAQEAENHDGSYWHAILHRREPDYSNARYWYDRAGDHPVFGEMQTCFTGWSPASFVAGCQREKSAEKIKPLLAMQVKEFELLFDHTFQLAIGGGK